MPGGTPARRAASAQRSSDRLGTAHLLDPARWIASVVLSRSSASLHAGRRREAFLVALTGTALLAVLGLLVRHEPTPRGDDEIYERMAQRPFATHTFPFGYRVGLPLLVHLLPLGTSSGFLLLAWLAAGGAAGFAYLLMRELGCRGQVAGMLAVLMCVSPPFLLVLIRGGRNPDIVTVLLLMAGTFYVVRRAYWQTALTLLLGVVFREAMLFVGPLAYAVWAQRAIDPAAARRAVAVVAPAACAYAGLRLGIPTIGKAQVPGYGESLWQGRLDVLEQGVGSLARELRRLFTVYGPLWLVAPFALRGMSFARRGLVLVGLSLVSMTFALDWGRMILLSAPVFYPAAGWVLTRRSKFLVPTSFALATLAIGYAVYMQLYGVKHGILDTGPPPYPVR